MVVGALSNTMGPCPLKFMGFSSSSRWLLVQLLILGFFPFAFLETVSESIPPLLEEGPPKGELLFHITRDPDQKTENFTIPCKADALPLPSYSWFKNGLHFTPEAEGAIMLEGVGTLFFPNPKQEDEGDYQCVATNSAGSVFSDIAKVRRGMIISFPKGEPRVVTAKIGQPLALKCDNPGGYPRPTLHWVLQESDGSLRSISPSRATMDDEGTLWFGIITKDDASEDALYACAASSAKRTEYRMGNWVYLNVTSEGTSGEPGEVSPFLQKVNEGEHKVLEGDDVRLHCIYGGNPLPQIRWWRKDRRKIPWDRITDFGKALEIADIRSFDAGEYFCEARCDPVKCDTHSFKVDVEAAPTFSEEPGTIDQPIGKNATFRCVAKGIPTPIITWSINGEPLEGKHEDTLHFSYLKMRDKGVIACNASNIHGYAYSTGFLNVLSYPPILEIQPVNTSGFAGESVTIHCKGYGAPDPHMTWSKIFDESDKEEEIRSDNYLYQIFKDRLIIKALSDHTSGLYKCTAVNIYGRASKTVSVQLKKSTAVTVAVVSPNAKAGETITLTCHVTADEGVKVGVTWLKDNEPLDIKSDKRITEQASNEKYASPLDRQLIIQNAKGSDSGVYFCRSKSSGDEAEDCLIITVEHPPEAPHVIELECSRREAYLKWGITGTQTSPILGYIVEVQTELHRGQWEEVRNEIRPSEIAIRTVALINLNPGLMYKFRVIAVNRAGSSPPSKPSGPCVAPGAVPDYNPRDVSTEVVDPTTIKVIWKAIRPREHNGPEFRYVIRWKRVVDDIEDDATVVEDYKDVWSDTVIEDWKQNGTKIRGLHEDTRYKIRVEAINSYGAAPGVEDVWASTDPYAPLLSPTYLRVQNITSTTAILFWNTVPENSVLGDPKGHEVELRTIGKDRDTSPISTDIISTGTGPNIKLNELSPFTNYEARVRVHSIKSPGPFSQRIKFRTGEGISSAVRELKALSVSSDSIIVSWKPPLHPRGILHDYLIRYWPLRKSKGDELELTALIEPGNVKINDLKKNTVYKISVAARNRRGKGVGRESLAQIKTHSTSYSQPGIPSFSWTVITGSGESDDAESFYDSDSDKDQEEIRSGGASLLSKNLYGDMSEVVTDVSRDYDVDENDLNNFDKGDNQEGVANTNNSDNDVTHINKDDKIDRGAIFNSDRDGDGDIDSVDEKNRYLLLGDSDGNGIIDSHDILDTNFDGSIDQEDFSVADVNKDGEITVADIRAADRDGDGDIDDKDIKDVDNDGDIDGYDLLLSDKDGDGDVDLVDEGHGVSLLINWEPDLSSNPGSAFYIKYRSTVDKKWSRSQIESRSLNQTLEGLMPDQAYKIQVIAKDGPFETPSETVIIGPFARGATHHPTGGINPLFMTWFIIAVIVAVLMLVIIVCSVWVYHRRVTRVSELRAELYKDYVPPPVTKVKNGDVEPGLSEKDKEEPTAESERQQMSALLRRQETVQSVDSFASHDDDFSEYGDEAMGRRFNDDGSLIFKKE